MTNRRTRTLATLLLVVVVLQFGYPVTQYGQWMTISYMVLYATMLGFGIISVHVEGEVVAPLVGATAVFLLCGAWFSVAQSNQAATAAMLISVALSMAALVFALLRFVFRRSDAPGSDLVMAATSAYLVIGGFFAATMTLMEMLAPGSFEDPQNPGVMAWEQFLYYAYVNLATLGYGDILPVSPWARSYASFIAVVGTLYLTVVVARLVGIWSTGATEEPGNREPATTEEPRSG